MAVQRGTVPGGGGGFSVVTAGVSRTPQTTATATTTTTTQSSESAASQLFDEFCCASTFHSTMDTFRRLSDLVELRPDTAAGGGSATLRQLRVGLASSWKAQSLWTKLDKRMSHWEYRRGTACTDTRVYTSTESSSSSIHHNSIHCGPNVSFHTPKQHNNTNIYTQLL